MLRSIWVKGNLLVPDGRKELYKYLIHINLSRLSTIALSIISDLWIHGLRVSFKVTAREHKWVDDRNGEWLSEKFSVLLILLSMI
jgi:hypothetical protein